MKKIACVFLGMIAVIMLMPLLALAETTGAPAAGMPYTWEILASIGGAMAATLAIVQAVKLPLDKVWRIPTRYVVFAIALALMLIAKAATTGLVWIDVPLVAVNAFVVAFAAMGAYELTFAKKDATK